MSSAIMRFKKLHTGEERLDMLLGIIKGLETLRMQIRIEKV